VFTNLVVDLLVNLLERDDLLKDVSLLLEFLRLAPVIKGARNIDLLGRMFPMRKKEDMLASEWPEKGLQQKRRDKIVP
jgi:hypothetical protein